ncbi:hypothetical protein QJS04_geneDACA012327 [Acorus gramineus]|uniref:Uncharacterized protein n=1 Tax=Acorus gramineus TaxID=55184 RepID=A0AAV9BDA5_ACOGR|nr:hypothetical protein QJS04_geneDACA012327 [Acorus gramineus]
MKLVWCPETASKVYIDTVKALSEGSDVAELVSAMAGGWRARLILEAWSRGDKVDTSLGLSIAARHTCGRHVCVVPDEESRSEYLSAMSVAGVAEVEVVVVVAGVEEEGVMEGVPEGVDFVVVDCTRREFKRVVRSARVGHRGAVLVCKNAAGLREVGGSGGGGGVGCQWLWWRGLLGEEARVVRSVFLPIGKGIEIVHVAGSGPSGGGGCGGSEAGLGRSRWIRHIDGITGEEHVFRRR